MFSPDFASWESTLRCNMSCSHCGLKAGPSCANLRGKELSTQEVIKLFDDLVLLGVSRLVISGGEFTTRSDWQDILKYSLSRFDLVRLITNGFLGSSIFEKIKSLKGLENLILSLSLDGLRESHDRNRREGSFDKIMEILKAETEIYRTVITTVTLANINELESMFELLMNILIPVWSIQLGLPEGRMRLDNFIGEDGVHNLSDRILSWQKRSDGIMEIVPDDCFGYGHDMRRNSPWIGCQAGRNLITILSDGSVTGCPTTFNQICGNIRRDSLVNIWNGERMDSYRGWIKGISCEICDGKICRGGCRAVRQIFGKQFCF